jgi:flavin-dependent dehydrogenase
MTTVLETRPRERPLVPDPESAAAEGPRLVNGSRVAVVGGGPAGSFFAYFLLEMAAMVDLELEVDVYEPRDYTKPGPASCNTCGGIISESLVQLLATEGISLPDSVVQRGLDSYVLHTAGNPDVHIDNPLQEKRIAAVHRGAGPRGIREVKWRSFDGYLQGLTVEKGAEIVQKRVDSVTWDGGRPQVKTRDGHVSTYDFLVGAVGVNTAAAKAFEGLGLKYKPPKVTRTYISEFFLGHESVEEHLGNSMHVFLLDLPRLKFSALIPKGDYVTLCLLGEDIDAALVQAFLDTPEVQRCFPSTWEKPADFCHCSPRMNIEAAVEPFSDRVVFIGDCGVSRLYKDGIGAAYRTAKAAAVAAAFQGISAEDFRAHYWPACRSLDIDNKIGTVVFIATHFIQRLGFARRAVVRMVVAEQQKRGKSRRMSTVLWDTFTGSAPYRDILIRLIHPVFLGRFLWNLAIGSLPSRRRT